MSRLFILNGARRGEQIDLPSGSFTVGTDESAAHLILADPEVASIHCRIAAIKGGGFGIQDLGSPAGTFVNGKRIATARLATGDRIRIGGIELSFGTEAAAAGAPAAAAPEPAPKPSATEKPATAIPGTERPAARSSGGDGDLSGQVIGGYRLESILGRGGMGIVYRATQVSLHRTVALKVLSPRLAHNPKFVTQFLTEARAAAQLHHPNVVTIFDVASESDLHYYSMEVFEGGSVEGLLKREKKLPVDRALSIARDAARALEFAESKKLLHRDVKPDNLMLTAQGVAKLADLGLAATTAQAEGGAEKQQIFGTPHFVSPEQARGGPVDHRSDLYSLGATIFRIITGRTPFTGASVSEILEAARTQEAPALRSLEPQVPEAVEQLVARLLKKSPSERPANATEVIAAIDAVLAPPAASSKKLVAGLGAVAIVAAGVAGWVLMQPKEQATTQPIVIKDTTETDRERAEREKAERELEDQKAENAFMQVKVLQGLGALELATKFEEVAKTYSSTSVAARARAEAQRLREEDKAKVAAAAAKAARSSAFMQQFDEGLRSRLSSGKFAEALTLAPTVEGYADAQENAEARAAIEAVPSRVSAGALVAAKEKLQTANTLLAANKIAEARAAASEVDALLKPLLAPGALAPEFAAPLAPLAKGAEQCLLSIREAETRAAKVAALAGHQSVRAILDGALEQMRQGRYSEAKSALESAPADATEADRGVLASLAAQAGAAAQLVDRLTQASQAKQLGADPMTDPTSGRSLKIVSIDASGVKLDAKPTPVALTWERLGASGFVALGMRILERTPAGTAQLAQAALASVSAFEATKLRSHQKSLRLDAPAFEKPPAVQLDSLADALALLPSAADGATPEVEAARARLTAEMDALNLWHRGLSSLAAGKFLDAESALGQLQKLTGTLSLALASDGSSAMPSAPAPR